jgi:hypothetical protein
MEASPPYDRPWTWRRGCRSEATGLPECEQSSTKSLNWHDLHTIYIYICLLTNSIQVVQIRQSSFVFITRVYVAIIMYRVIGVRTSTIQYVWLHPVADLGFYIGCANSVVNF